MNFTTDVKKELVMRGIGDKDNMAAKCAAFSAFVKTSGTLGFAGDEPAFFLVSETESVAGFFMELFAEIFDSELSVTHAAKDKKSGRDKLIMQCPQAVSFFALKKLGIAKTDKTFREGILQSLVNTDEKRIAYIIGAFLGGGSCILPSGTGAGYHLEFVFSDRKTAWDFCRVLAQFELIAKLVERKDTFVAYIKSKEMISDFLAVIGATNALKKFAAFVEKRDEANRDNRAKNCMAGNADKTAIAAVRQVVALKKLEESNYKDMSEELISLAKTRLKNPTMSLRELAEYVGISKSCLNHRMRKLMELAEEL